MFKHHFQNNIVKNNELLDWPAWQHVFALCQEKVKILLPNNKTAVHFCANFCCTCVHCFVWMKISGKPFPQHDWCAADTSQTNDSLWRRHVFWRTLTGPDKPQLETCVVMFLSCWKLAHELCSSTKWFSPTNEFIKVKLIKVPKVIRWKVVKLWMQRKHGNHLIRQVRN